MKVLPIKERVFQLVSIIYILRKLGQIFSL